MKLSISNIAWDKEQDEEMYKYLSDNKVDGIEIAPTRIIQEEPYSHIQEAKEYAKNLKDKYNLEISSMQSIWYGKQEKIFENQQERENLIEYTKKAIDFAEAIRCTNLVFGCPKNRVINNIQQDYQIALQFFNIIGNYAKNKGVYFSIEPNPTIYNTNFITTTQEAIDLVKDLNNSNVKINLDLGTIIQNGENINILDGTIDLINHVHISEPNLEYIQKRDLHNQLLTLLIKNNYKGYISIEMKNQNNISKVKEIIQYVNKIFKENII